MTTPEARLAELGIELPPPPRPVASYVTSVRSGSLVHTSGHGPIGPDGVVTGKVGIDLDVAAGQAAARLTTLNLLSTVRAELGTLDAVARVVKVLGMVHCGPDFTEHPAVINGCSDLLLEVFGDRGRHARSAVGVASLPMGMAVEIEMVVEAV